MKIHGITIYLNDNYKIDLKEILEIIGEAGKSSQWKISGAECFGDSAEKTHEISDNGKEISDKEFYKLVSNIYQTLDGTFQAFKIDENLTWLLIRSIRGDEFDIETEDRELLKKFRDSLQNVKDLIY